MTAKNAKTPTAAALVSAGLCTLVLIAVFLIVLFVAAVLTVAVGAAPLPTPPPQIVLVYAVRLFALACGTPVAAAAALWALAIFAVAFLFFRPRRPAPGSARSRSTVRWGRCAPLVSIALAGMIPLLLYTRGRFEEIAAVEKRLAMEFMKKNEQIMQETGGLGTDALDLRKSAKGRPVIARNDACDVTPPGVVVAVIRVPGRGAGGASWPRTFDCPPASPFPILGRTGE